MRLLKFDSIAFRNFEHPSLPPEEVAQFSEVLLNIFEAGLCQDLGSKFTIDFPIRAFNFFFSGQRAAAFTGHLGTLQRRIFSLQVSQRVGQGMDKCSRNREGAFVSCPSPPLSFQVHSAISC